MKQWIIPSIEELDLKNTAWGSNGGWINSGNSHWVNNLQHNVGGNNPLPPGQDDIGGCNDNFWGGNGLPWDVRSTDNPFWDPNPLS